MNFFGRKKQSYNSPSAVSATSNHAASAAATRTSTANTVVHLRESIATQEKREAHLHKKIDDLTAEAKAKMAKKDKKGAFSFPFYFRCYCFCYCVYFFCCVAKRRDRYVVKSLGGKKAPSIIYMASIAIIERPTSLSGKSKKECGYDFLRSSLGNSLSAL